MQRPGPPRPPESATLGQGGPRKGFACELGMGGVTAKDISQHGTLIMALGRLNLFQGKV